MSTDFLPKPGNRTGTWSPKSLHIQTEDWTAGVIAEDMKRLGYICTFGTDVPESAEYLIVPLAPEGDTQADKLRPSEIVRMVRNLIEDGTTIQRTSDMTVERR